jgi:hypothetical protein
MKYKTKLKVLSILYDLLSMVFWMCWILAPIFLILAWWQYTLAVIMVAFICKWVKQEIRFFVFSEMIRIEIKIKKFKEQYLMKISKKE